jgi:hypothetical protein
MSVESEKAKVAYEIFRDLGPKRTLPGLAAAMGRDPSYLSTLKQWSSKFSWQKRALAHDHKTIREGLAQRTVFREQGLQQLAEGVDEAVGQVLGIIRDQRMVPIKDRNGDKIGEKPLIAASTKLEASKLLLGIVGIVPVKRIELTQDQESLDEKIDKLLSEVPTEKLAALEEIFASDS